MLILHLKKACQISIFAILYVVNVKFEILSFYKCKLYKYVKSSHPEFNPHPVVLGLGGAVDPRLADGQIDHFLANYKFITNTVSE